MTTVIYAGDAYVSRESGIQIEIVQSLLPEIDKKCAENRYNRKLMNVLEVSKKALNFLLLRVSLIFMCTFRYRGSRTK